jgi:hypothetical protein
LVEALLESIWPDNPAKADSRSASCSRACDEWHRASTSRWRDSIEQGPESWGNVLVANGSPGAARGKENRDMTKTRWMTVVGAALVTGLWQAPAFAEDKAKDQPKTEEVKKETTKSAAGKTAKKDAKKDAPAEEAPKAQP